MISPTNFSKNFPTNFQILAKISHKFTNFSKNFPTNFVYLLDVNPQSDNDFNLALESDYEANTFVDFKPEEPTALLNITIIDDSQFEDTEILNVRIQPGKNLYNRSNPYNATVFIVDNESK